MVINSTAVQGFSDAYISLLNLLPENFRILIPLAIVSLVIALYGIFIWYFYRFLARRDILKLNLKKYNKFEYGGFLKFFAVIFYIIEFIIVIPLITFLWFALLSAILVVLAKEQTVQTVMLISAAIVCAVRMAAYFNEDLSKDLAKMFPFTLLGIVILSPGFFNFETTIQRFTEIPSLLSQLMYYFIFILIIETILRLIYLPFGIFDSNED